MESVTAPHHCCWKTSLLFVLLLILLLLGRVECAARGEGVLGRGKGVLRVRITSFSNPQAKDADGNCCMNHRRATPCRGYCRTFFRVCATHTPRPYIVHKSGLMRARTNLSSLLAARTHMDQDNPALLAPTPAPHALKLGGRGRGQRLTRTRALRGGWRALNPNVPCTLGLLVTEVVANNSLHASREGALDITFPFTSPWPLSFKLIMEAWHDVTGQLFKTQQALQINERVGKLIMRHTGRHIIEAGAPWTDYTYSPSHTSLQYSIRVNCASPYLGSKCSKSCEDVSGPDSHIECSEDGGFRCQEGWQGERCSEPTCRPGCDPLHGFCNTPGECRCRVGWRGENCDQCTTLPGCQHGYCNKTSFECVCEPGWNGLFCSQPECRENCHGTRGYCDLPGECKCRIGWGGPTCDECKPLPGCVNGDCTKPLECRCHEGWTGLFCQIPICGFNCSKEHGSCIKPGECRCEVGWWGDNCDTCFAYPGCKHGTCNNPWECNCLPGWHGMLCDERAQDHGFCSTHQGICLNGGTCIDVPGSRNFTCSCPSLFTGQQCDYLADVPSDVQQQPDQKPVPANIAPTRIPRLQVVTADSSSPTGTYSLVQTTTTAAPTVPTTHATANDSDAKDARRLLLQNTARISFRQPKFITREEDGAGKLPFTVVERKLLPLPVFLPRVSEIIPGEEGPTRLLKTVTKQPTPILVLDINSPRNVQENLVIKNSLQQELGIPREFQADEDRRFLRHQQGGPDFVEEFDEGEPSMEASGSFASTQVSGEEIIKNIRQRPLFVSAQASALPRNNPVNSVTLRTRSDRIQKSGASNRPIPISGFRSSTITPPPPSPETTTTTVKSPQNPNTPEPANTDILNVGSHSEISVSAEGLVPEGREDSNTQTYYEANSNGRVHIGDVSEVDDDLPHDEIYDAFIELKKV